jgi:hypothetical protein
VLVDDHHLAVLHDVVDIALEQVWARSAGMHVVQKLQVSAGVELSPSSSIPRGQQLSTNSWPASVSSPGAGLFVDREVPSSPFGFLALQLGIRRLMRL